MIISRLWKFLMLTGPLYLVGLAALIGKIVDIPWMNSFALQPIFLAPVGIIFFVYEWIISVISAKESLKDKNSALHTLRFRRVWAPGLVAASLLTSGILFMVSYEEARMDVFSDAVPWFPSGWIWLYYLVGFLSPIPKNMVLNPTIVKKFFSSKYNDQSPQTTRINP